MAVVAPYPWLEDAANQLNALEDRLPNAILLYGNAGIGLVDLARAFAESLMCESPKADGTACGKCPGCRFMKADTHPDCRWVTSEFMADELGLPYAAPDSSGKRTKLSREILIHQVRALSDFLTTSAHRGGRRVVVIYPADMIRAEAAASLLKSMEEPPEGLIYVLVAEDIDAVLPTIRSRSRLLRVGMPDKAQALAWLGKYKRIKNPEAALALAGGAPLAALKDTSGLTLKPKAQGVLSDLLLKGGALSPDAVVRAYSADMTTPALALYLSRWCFDLQCVAAGLPAHYFIEFADRMPALVANTTPVRLMELNKKVAQMRRTAEHPLFGRQVFEAILFAYTDALA